MKNNQLKTRIATTVVLLVVVFSTARSQRLLSFGIKGGIVKAEQTWEGSTNPLDKNTIWGADLGVFAEMATVLGVSLQLELHYTQKGHTFTVIETQLANNPQGYIDLGPVDIKSRYHYLSVPVLLKYSSDVWVVRPFVATGPSLEYLIKGPSLDYNRAELGMVISVGVTTSFGFVHSLSGEVRYVYGLTPSYESKFLTINTRTLNFLLGIGF
jgi:hypothetical protein